MKVSDKAKIIKLRWDRERETKIKKDLWKLRVIT